MKQIQVTQGINGYPKGIYDAQIFESVEELQDSGRGIFHVFRKRNGWDLWELVSAEYGAFDMEERLNMHKSDDEVLLNIPANYKFDDILNTIEKHVDLEDEENKDWAIELAEEINKYHKEEDEVFIIEYLLEEYREKYPRKAVQYKYDVWTYAIGYKVEQ